MMNLVRINSVKPLHDFVVYVEFTDGSTREIDLEPYLRGEIFEQIRTNKDIFRAIKVDEQMKTLCWENGADIDPDTLYYNLKPAWDEETEIELAK